MVINKIKTKKKHKKTYKQLCIDTIILLVVSYMMASPVAEQ